MASFGTGGLDRRYFYHLQKSVGATMRYLGRFGVLACAALYGAIGLAGVFFFASEPGMTSSTEGYGIARPAAHAMVLPN